MFFPRIIFVLLTAAALLAARPACARTFVTQDEALALAFPTAKVERITVALSSQQLDRVEALCGERPSGALVIPYRATRDGHPVGTAYFDVHKVRTLPATCMIVVRPDGTVGRIEILSFSEPQEYMAPERWNAQFTGRALGENLQLKHDIATLTGATLTARSTTRAVRRILAIHQVIAETAAAPAGTP